MTEDEYVAVCEEYQRKFGSLPGVPPLDFGVPMMTLEKEASYMLAAIEAGKPIDWLEVLKPLPAGCVS